MIVNCPNCYHRFSLFEAVEDDCARELFKLTASMTGTLWRDMVPYLALFKPRKQPLRWSRALALVEDVMDLHDCGAQVLSAALRKTVTAFADKRSKCDWKPLKNHNYLRSVIDTVRQSADAEGPSSTPAPAHGGKTPTSKTGQALSALQEFGNE